MPPPKMESKNAPTMSPCHVGAPIADLRADLKSSGVFQLLASSSIVCMTMRGPTSAGDLLDGQQSGEPFAAGSSKPIPYASDVASACAAKTKSRNCRLMKELVPVGRVKQ